MGGGESKEEEAKEDPTNKASDLHISLDPQKWEFNSRKEDWESYTERLDMYFLANDVSTEKQTAILLSSVGPKTYGLLKDLCSPSKPSEKKYPELVGLVSDHLGSIPRARYRFNMAKQATTESMADFVGRLRLLASRCNFDNPDDRVCDQLIFGMSEDSVRNNLLQQRRLTVAKACKVATENGDGKKKDSAQKKNDEKRDEEEFCYCCGKTNHLTRDCRFRFQKGGNRQNRGPDNPKSGAKQ